MSAAPRSVLLLGLDFGSTTSSVLIARATLSTHPGTGRATLADAEPVFQPASVFTPFVDADTLDLDAIDSLIDDWLASAGIASADCFAGGALVTGLAAQRRNADGLRARLHARLGDVVVATADDPRLESWVAFMGACGALSDAQPDATWLNLDIGGGTTNTAVGRGGQVLATGCHFIGARHIQVVPGGWHVTGWTPHAHAIATAIGLDHRPGTTWPAAAVERFVGWQVAALEAIVAGDRGFFADGAGRQIAQVPFEWPAGLSPACARVTFSGGVGELVYAIADGRPLPPATRFGDLGIELARAIVASPRLSAAVAAHRPARTGGATVLGLALHQTRIAGSTLHLPLAVPLPWPDLPIVARLDADADRAAIAQAVARAGHGTTGGCVQWSVDAAQATRERVHAFAVDLRAVLDARAAVAADPPLLLVLVACDVAKALGGYATGWGSAHRHVAVIDEVAVPRAHFVRIGRAHHGAVPVSFHGLYG